MGKRVPPRQKPEVAFQSSPKLQALGGGSTKCSWAQSQPSFTEIYDRALPFYTKTYLEASCLRRPFVIHSTRFVFLGEKAKPLCKARMGTLLLVTKLCFSDIACARQAWTPSELLPQQRATWEEEVVGALLWPQVNAG